MLKQRREKQQQMELVIMEQMVPEDHFLRKVDRAVDFSFIYDLCAPLYCADNGRPAIDPELVGGILGCPVKAAKDPGQRPACGCCESVDIGAYNTCPGGCAYCYATTGRAAALRCAAAHDPAAPMLTGWPRGGERISDRAVRSLKTAQTTLY